MYTYVHTPPAGSPGSGKSTLAQQVACRISQLCRQRGMSRTAAVAPMDGFHYYKKQLDAMPDPQVGLGLGNGNSCVLSAGQRGWCDLAHRSCFGQVGTQAASSADRGTAPVADVEPLHCFLECCAVHCVQCVQITWPKGRATDLHSQQKPVQQRLLALPMAVHCHFAPCQHCRVQWMVCCCWCLQEAYARRGAHWTFDGAAFVAAIRRLKQHGAASLPSFDHGVGDPIEDDIQIDAAQHAVVLVEGNYLFLEQDPWVQLRGLFDDAWFVDCPVDLAMQRVFDRQVAIGLAPDVSLGRIAGNDRPNAVLVNASKGAARLLVPSNVPFAGSAAAAAGAAVDAAAERASG